MSDFIRLTPRSLSPLVRKLQGHLPGKDGVNLQRILSSSAKGTMPEDLADVLFADLTDRAARLKAMKKYIKKLNDTATAEQIQLKASFSVAKGVVFSGVPYVPGGVSRHKNDFVKNAEALTVDGREGTSAYRALSKRLREKRPSRTLLVASNGVGKTALCRSIDETERDRYRKGEALDYPVVVDLSFCKDLKMEIASGEEGQNVPVFDAQRIVETCLQKDVRHDLIYDFAEGQERKVVIFDGIDHLFLKLSTDDERRALASALDDYATSLKAEHVVVAARDEYFTNEGQIGSLFPEGIDVWRLKAADGAPRVLSHEEDCIMGPARQDLEEALAMTLAASPGHVISAQELALWVEAYREATGLGVPAPEVEKPRIAPRTRDYSVFKDPFLWGYEPKTAKVSSVPESEGTTRLVPKDQGVAAFNERLLRSVACDTFLTRKGQLPNGDTVYGFPPAQPPEVPMVPFGYEGWRRFTPAI